MYPDSHLRIFIGLLLICFVSLIAGCGRQSNPANPETTNKASIEADNGSAGSTASQPRHSAQNAVTVSPIDAVHVKPGASGETTISVVVHDGFHANSNPPSDPGLIPVTISLEGKDGISSMQPAYPPPSATRTFKFSQTPLKVYEGTVQIKVPLKVAGSAKSGSVTLQGYVRAQPCDEEVCYPPRNIDFTLPIVID